MRSSTGTQHAHLLPPCPWLLSHYKGNIEKLKETGPQSLKYLLPSPVVIDKYFFLSQLASVVILTHISFIYVQFKRYFIFYFINYSLELHKVNIFKLMLKLDTQSSKSDSTVLIIHRKEKIGAEQKQSGIKSQVMLAWA